MSRKRIEDGFKIVRGTMQVMCSSQSYNGGKLNRKRLAKCVSDMVLNDDKITIHGQKVSIPEGYRMVGNIARGAIGGVRPPFPSDVELPKNLKNWIDNTMPGKIPNDPMAKQVFAKEAERIYRQAMSLLYPASIMINAMDPAGKQIVDEMDADLGTYMTGDAALKAQTLNDVKHKVPYHIDNTPPYGIDIRLRPDSLTEGYDGELIPAELIRILMDGLNSDVGGQPVGEQLSDHESLVTAIRDAVGKLGDADTIAEKLPGLTVKKVDMSGGAVTGVELGPRVGATEAPTFLINELNGQNDYAKRLAVDYVYMQAMQMLKDNGITPNAEIREMVAEKMAPKLKGMEAFQIAAQMVRMPAGEVELEQVPLDLIRPIVPTLNEWRRNGHMYDADQVGVVTSLNTFYRDGLKKKPDDMSPDDMARLIANEAVEILARGKGVTYATDSDRNNKARAHGKYFRSLALTGFNADGTRS